MSRWKRAKRATGLLSVLAALTQASCAEPEAATEVLVIVDSDLSVPAKIHALHVAVYDRAGSEKLRERSFALSKEPGKTAQFTLPLSFSLVPDKNDSASDFRLVITGRGPGPDGAEVAVVEQQAIASFRRATAQRLDMFLHQSCAGELCSDGTEDGLSANTCLIGGECVPVPVLRDLPRATGKPLGGYVTKEPMEADAGDKEPDAGDKEPDAGEMCVSDDCMDLCPDDAEKMAPGACGCGVPDVDSDDDGHADCNDACPNDREKAAPGLCGCNQSDGDRDDDGRIDCQDACPDNPKKTEPGVCGCSLPDEDLDSSGILDCMERCVEHTEVFVAGAHTLIQGPCGQVRVQLWGAGGAGGGSAGLWGSVSANIGGAGGYVEGNLTVTPGDELELRVGGGGRGCPAAGENATASFNGGAGANTIGTAGKAGSDGTVEGGLGGNAGKANAGGSGSYGGGGGGAGQGSAAGGWGRGGGGGAASVLSLNSSISMLAGGGGGGGGSASDFQASGVPGGAGGPGCGAAGKNGSVVAGGSGGGGGGGGGVCLGGADSQQGTGRTPYDPDGLLPSGTARGGAANCNAGGAGYAIVTFSD